jgi:ribosomal protein S18 acetylase RimI-like enzyme
VRVERVAEPSDEVLHALDRLLPQLNPQLSGPSRELLQRVVEDRAVALLVARDGDTIVGTATLAVVPTPTWVNAHVNDVVVDAGARGLGAGRALMEAAIALARERGAQVVRLTSAERRSEAHALYESLGFRHTGSRAYRLDL